MILDQSLMFSDEQAITTSAASTNVVDLVDARDMGIGDSPALKLLVSVPTAFTTDTTNASTLTIAIQGSTNSTTSNFTTLAQSPAYGVASLGAGAKLFPIDLPALPSGQAMPRYLRLSYSVGSAAFSTGALIGTLVLGRDDGPIYPKNFVNAYPTD